MEAVCLLSDGHGPGWQTVPVHDPVVQDAANHAITTLQKRSNSLFPYELQEVVHAKAEVSVVSNFDYMDNWGTWEMTLLVKLM